MEKENNGGNKKTQFKEKRIYFKEYKHENEEQRRRFDCYRSNWNLVLAGKRWDSKYNQYSLIPNTRVTLPYEEGSREVITLLNEAIDRLLQYKAVGSDFGKEIFNEGLESAKGQTFKIVVKVGTHGDIKMFFSIEQDGNKDIIAIEDNSGIKSTIDRPYYAKVLETFRDKLTYYLNDFEAADKFNFQLLNQNNDNNKKEVKETAADDDYPF